MIGLNYEYESSFKNINFFFNFTKTNLIYFTLYKNKSDFFYNKILLFTLYKNISDFFFTNQISFFFLYQNRFDFYSSNPILQNRFDFSLRGGHIPKTNLFKLIVAKCLSSVLQHIIQHLTKGYIMVIKA